MPAWLPHIDSSVVLDGLTSLLLLFSLLILRALIVRAIAKNPTLSDGSETSMGSFGPQYHGVPVAGGVGRHLGARTPSLSPLPRGVVLVTKELILCWNGRRYGWGGEVYSVGDRIQIAGHRGVVLDHDIFATKLLEIGPGQASHLYTGRVTVFPNSLLFTNALVKENPGQEYGLYLLVIQLRDNDDWRDAERHLLDAAKAECTPFMEEAGRQMKLLE